MIEMKLSYDNIEEEGCLYDVLKDDLYLLHYPELNNMKGKGLMFKKLTLKNKSDFYVLYADRKRPNISPKVIKHYQRGRPRSECHDPSSITIRYNNMYHLVGNVFIFV